VTLYIKLLLKPVTLRQDWNKDLILRNKENNTTDPNLKYHSQDSYKSNIPVKLKCQISILK